MAQATSDWEVLTRLIDVAGRDVVEVGCGEGRLVQALDAAGARAIGIEVSVEKVRRARHANDGSGARFEVGWGESLPLSADSQDVVVYLRSLHHVPLDALDGALREARRVLRAGGRLGVLEPLPQGDFYALVSLVEDETEVRAAAQAALDRAGEFGFAAEAREEYELHARVRDLGELRARLVDVDPARGPVFDAHWYELERRFAAGGELRDGVRWFTQPHRVRVLRAV